MSQSSSQPADFATRQQSLDTSISCIVRAPAGSGKTSLLVARCLRLLTKVQQPEHLLAITHTNKAAQEMLARISAALTNPQTMDSLTCLASQKAREHIQKQNLTVQEVIQRLQIQTIDSLCTKIANSSHNQQLHAPHARVLDDPHHWYQTAANLVLTELWEQPDDSLLLVWQHYGCDSHALKEVLTRLLYTREQWLSILLPASQQTNNTAFAKLLSHGWRNELLRRLSQLAAIPSSVRKTLIEIAKSALAMQECTQHPQSTNNKQQEKYALLQSVCDVPISLRTTHTPNSQSLDTLSDKEIYAQRMWWNSVQQWLIKKDGSGMYSRVSDLGFPANNKIMPHAKKSNIAYKQHAKECIENLQSDSVFFHALAMPLPVVSLPTSDTTFLAAVATLAVRAAAWLKVLYTREGITDFTQTALHALDALSHNQYEQNSETKIEHILIDEFQDISPLQWQLLEILVSQWNIDKPSKKNNKNQVNTLFVVGDPMQSIYGFRKAEVALFTQAFEKGIGNISLTKLHLTSNFRSDPLLVTWVNSLGNTIFSQKTETDFYPSIPQISRHHTNTAHVHTHEVNDTIAYVIHILKESLATHTHDDSIAILVQRRAIGTKYITACKKAGINYQAIDMQKLGGSQHIVDMCNLARWLDRPQDWKAMLGMFRMVQVGLSLELCTTIYQLHVHNPLIAIQKALYSNACQSLRLQHINAFEKLTWLWGNLSSALPLRGKQNFAFLVENLWHNLGFHLLLTSDEQQHIHLLLEKINELATHAPGAWSVSWERLDRFVNTHYINSQYIENKDAPIVHIMTCHKAKGLEFTTVIIPDVDASFGSTQERRKPFLYHVNPILSQPLLMAASASRGEIQSHINYRYIQHQTKLRQQAEQRRLLYVAITRAKTHLWLLKENITNNPDTRNTTSKRQNFGTWLQEAGVAFSTIQTKQASPKLQPVFPLLTQIENCAEFWQHCPQKGYLEQNLQFVPTDTISLHSHENTGKTQKVARDSSMHTTHIQHPIAITQNLPKNSDHRISRQELGKQLHRVMQSLHTFVAHANSNPTQEQLADHITKNRTLWQRELTWNAPFGGKLLAQQLDHALDRLACDSHLLWLCAKRQHVYHEHHWLQYAKSMDIQYNNQYIDLLFYDNESWWIIDYKLLQKQPHESDVTFANRAKNYYAQQLESYAHSLYAYLHTVEHAKKPTSIQCGIYIFIHNAWITWTVTPSLDNDTHN